MNKEQLLNTIDSLEYENYKLQEQIIDNDYQIEQLKQELNDLGE